MSGFKRNSLTAALCYKNPKTALDWLEKAFGFEPALVITDTEGNIVHAEMQFGDGRIMVGGEADDHKSPTSLGGKNTQLVHVHMDEGVDVHCTRAREAGAIILQELETQFYGDRTYRAKDPEGHIWSFGQTVKEVSPEEWEKAGVVAKIRS